MCGRHAVCETGCHAACCLVLPPGIYTARSAATALRISLVLPPPLSRPALPPALAQLDFRFFCGVVAWQPGELEKDVAAGAWHTAACSRLLVLKQCLQLPTPLWREVMCLMGGRYAEQAREQQRLDEGGEPGA